MKPSTRPANGTAGKSRLQLVKAGNVGKRKEVGFKVLTLSQLVPDARNAREDFGEITNLADSIKTHGIVNPITVRPLPNGKYEIVAGERRFRAAQIAKLKEVPTIVGDFTDRSSLEVQLIENIQRKDLHPIEEARAYQKMMDEFGYTQGQLAKIVGRSRVAINETLKALSLPNDLQDRCLKSDTFASRYQILELAKVEDPKKQLAFVKQAEAGHPMTIETLRKEKKKPAKKADAPAPKATSHKYTTNRGDTITIRTQRKQLTKADRIQALEYALAFEKQEPA